MPAPTIAKRIARTFAREGAAVVLAGRTQTALQTVADAITAEDGERT